MNKIQLINEAFEKAERLESKLTPWCFSVGGFTSPKIRHLMNQLGAISKNYLEIGTHRGALSVATCYGNSVNALLIDNWVEFNETDAREDFYRNIRNLENDIKFIEQDCFTVELAPHRFDLYLFDAEHSLEAHNKALTYFYPSMENQFIFCVDDANWSQVQQGTAEGIARMGLKVIAQWSRSGEDWHNGYQVFLLEK